MEMTKAPDASFTIMYDASSDEESKANHHSDDTQVSSQTEHEKNDDQLEESTHINTDGILAVNADQKLASQDSVPDSPSSESIVVAIPDLKTPETNYDDNSKDESNAEEKCETILHREVLAEQTASKTPENPPKIECLGPVNIDGSDLPSHNNDLSEDKNSLDDGVDVAQVCEESNISVAKALQMERQKMSLSLNEELIRTDKKPAVYPKRSITADNCTIAHFEKSEESTVLSNQLKIPDAARPNIKKSKSFRLDRDNVYPDKDQQCAETAAMMNKRVSDICRSFLNKTRPGVKPPEEPLSSPAPQRKLMKWVNANGKWQRIPIDEQTPPTEYDDRTAFRRQEDDNTDNMECPNASKGAKDNKHTQKLYDQKKELVQTSSIYAMTEEAEDNALRDNELPKNKETAQTSATESKQSIYSNHVHHIDNEKPETSDIYGKLSTNESDVVDIKVKDNEAQENIADKETHYDENQSEVQSQTASQDVIVTEKSIVHGSSSDIQSHVDISPNENKERISETKEVRVVTKCDQNDTISKDVHKELHVQFDKSEDLKTSIALDTKDVPELKMQDFLLGFGDYQSRKKDLLRFTKREQGELSTTTKQDVDLPKQIPKLKAVKIQEEIYECKPEYMKDSNLQLLETETTSCKNSQENNADLCSSETVTAEAESDFEQETWTLTRVSLRKSNTFSGIDSDKPTFQQGRRGLVEGLSASTKSLDVYSCPYTSTATTKTPTSPNRIHSKDDSSINEKPYKMRSRSRSVETVQRAPTTQDTKSRSFKMPSMMGAFSGFRRRNKDAKEANTRAVVDDDNEKASHVGGSAEDDERAATKSEKRKLKLPLFMRGDRSKTLPRTKLLSEIVEVEENKDDLSQSPEQQRQQQQQQQKRQQQNHDLHGRLTANPVQRSNKRRSLSLPTGSLAFGDARIVYKNGHFTIETMDGTELDSTRPLGGSNGDHVSQNALNDIYLNGVPPGERSKHQGEITTMGKGDTGEGIHLQRSHRMKRQYGKTTLSKNDSSEYEDVFISYECDIENISPNSQVEMSSGILSDSHSTEVCSNSSRLSEMSLGSSCSEGMDDMDSHEGDSGMQSTGGSGYIDDNGEGKRVAQRARRTSSFKQAQEAGLKANQNNTDTISDGEMTRRRAGSLDDSQPNDLNKTSANNKATLFQKMIPKRKALNENLNTFSKQSDSAKEFFAKKMTLKGLFKKNKSESAVGSPVKTMHPVSPPIAAFQRDDDIGSVDTPPSSPFMHADLRRRHTSADIIHIKPQSETSNTDSNSTTPTQERNILIQRHSVSTPTTPSHEVNSFISSVSSCSVASSKEADQVSVSSFSSATSSVQSIQSPPPLDQQPNKPKTPKPVGASPRRNPSTGSVSSHYRSHSAHRTKSVTSLESDHSGEGSVIENDMVHCRCECGQKLGQVKAGEEYSESSHDSSSLSLCQYCRRLAEYYRTSSGLLNSNVDRLRKHSLVGRQNSDEGACVRDRERVRSGDDDNRGHKDSTSRGSYERLCIVSQTDVVSSNSNDSGIQRDDSLHSSNDSLKVTPEGPVRLRRRKSSSPPLERPRSEVAVRWADLDPDECDGGMVNPVRMRQRDSVSRSRPRPKSDFEGSSFLSDRMRAFGSEVDLQPYCSLRNLYEMRRRDLDKQKNRRMSTPHPIKSRLQRSPRKLQKSTSLVRSNSMPENLDKLHKRRKLNHLLDFHMDTFTRNVMDLDQYSDDSDLSFDHFSLSEKNGSIRSSQGHLTGLDEIEDNLTFAEALWDHITMDPEELAFRAQDVIEILDMSDKDWWFGVIDDREGWFPATFVRLRVNQDQMDEEEELELTMQQDVSLSPKQRRISMFNKNQARTNVVNEIINAEREYVKHLKDVVEGYIVHARKRKEMFPQERIELIFGNLETIYTFAQKFLEQLEQCIDEIPHLSEIGQCFLDNVRGFEIYSDYCNNHPSAIEELKELCRDSKYKHFFEACRLLQELAEIPLEGFLLTPVQKICKYQLQLGELLKYTPPDHADYTLVRDALVAMRKIATLINERKRKMESIEKIAAWQHSVVDWEGEDLLTCSSELIFSGEVNKINTAGWSQERYFFLFDHQLIYCKKEFLKRHLFSYKGRIDIDQCEVVDVPDGKDTQYNVTVKNAWKIHEVHKDKWYLLYAKTAALKERWLKALQDERKRVQEDRDNDFCVPDHWKQSVLNKVRSQSSLKDKHSSRGSYGPGYQKDIKDFTYSTLPRRVRNQKQDKKKGWFIFGGGKKSKR